MESRWQPWLLKVWGPYGTSNLPFFWLLAVRHKLWQLEGRCGHQLSRPPLAHGVWEQELAAVGTQQSQQAASQLPPPLHTGRAPWGAPGDGTCAVQTGLAGLEAGLLCDCSGCARRSYQQSWKLVALCLKEKLNEISCYICTRFFCFLDCASRLCCSLCIPRRL